MSLTTFLLTDTARSGINVQYARPTPSENQNGSTGRFYPSPSGPVAPTEKNLDSQDQQNQESDVTVTAPFTILRSRPAATTATTPTATISTTSPRKRAAIQDPHSAIVFECPLIWNDHISRPDFLDDSLIDAVLEVAQEYGVLLNKTSTNMVPKTEKIRDVCYRYYYRLYDVAEDIAKKTTDIDCTEDLEALLDETMAECLYNVGISHILAAFQNIGEVGESIPHLKKAAAVFDFCMNEGLTEESDKTHIHDDNLRVLSCISLGTAYEVSLQYYYCDTYHMVDTNTTLAHSASYYYALAGAIIHESSGIPNREMMLNFCNIKSLFFDALKYFIKSIEVGSTKGASRRRRATDAFDACLDHVLQQLPGERTPLEMEVAWYQKRCSKFRKMLKKGRMPEGAFSNKLRRSDEYSVLVPKGVIEPEFPFEILEFKALVERRADEELEMAAEEIPMAASTGTRMGSTSMTSPAPAHDDEVSVASEAPAFSNINLSVNVYANNQDIRLLPPPIHPGATHYHLITTMISLKAPSLKPPPKKKLIGDDEFAMSASQFSTLSMARSQANTNITTRSLVSASNSKQAAAAEAAEEVSHQDACSHCALIFIIDINHQNADTRDLARTAAAFAARCARLDEQDRFGVVFFDKFGEPHLSIGAATEERVRKMADSILHAKPLLKFDGCKGAYLVRALQQSIDVLANLEEKEGIDPAVSPYTGNKSIVVVSDGLGNALPSDAENWSKWSTPAVREAFTNSGVTINTFAAGDAADHELLTSIATHTKGSNATYVSFENEIGVAKLRRWIVLIVSSAKQRVASSITAVLKCAPSILVASVVTDFYKPPPTTKYSSLKNEASIPILPLSCENESNILVTFAVPQTHSKRDVIALGSGELKFFDSIRGVWDSRPLVIKNICSHRIVSREIHKWVATLQAQDCKGVVQCVTPSASKNFLRGSELIGKGDMISTADKGFATLVTVEGTRFEIKPHTSFRVDEVSENSLTVTLKKGAVSIVTANECSVKANVDGNYLIQIDPSSCVSLAYDKDGDFNANCVVGQAAITPVAAMANIANKKQRQSTRQSTRSSTQKVDLIKLPAPRQTMARVPDAPSIPWVVNEKSFFTWIAYDNETSRRLKNSIRIQTHYWRTLCASVLRMVARFMHRSLRHGTLTHNFASSCCSQIVMYTTLTKNKFDMANSIAYSTSNKFLDKLRRVIEDALQLSATRNRDQRTWNDAYHVQELANAVAAERGGKFFATTDVEEQIHAQLDAKARYEQFLADEKDREEQGSRDAESVSRMERLMELFGQWDFGAVNVAEVRHLLTVLYDMPSVMDAAPQMDDILRTIGCQHSLTPAQFCSVFSHCASRLKTNEFIILHEVLLEKLKYLSESIEKDRVRRSLFAVFIKLDESMQGFVTIPSIVTAIHAAFGDNIKTFRRIEKMTKAAVLVRNSMLAQCDEDRILVGNHPRLGIAVTGSFAMSPSQNAEKYLRGVTEAERAQLLAEHEQWLAKERKQAASYWSEATIETASDIQVTLDVFLQIMIEFFLPDGRALIEEISQDEEDTVHAEIKGLHNIVEQRCKQPGTMALILRRQNQETELEHLISWDMRHVFDGVSKKNVLAVTDTKFQPSDPSLIQAICAPVCFLMGISAPVRRRPATGSEVTASTTAVVAPPPPAEGVETQTSPSMPASASSASGTILYTDYFMAVKRHLKSDYAGFFSSLSKLPLLSVSHRQAMKVAAQLEDRRLDPEHCSVIYPVLAHLLSWVRLVMRITYLVHSYDLPPATTNRLISDAVATQKGALALTKPSNLPFEVQPPHKEIVSSTAKRFARSYQESYVTPPNDGTYGKTSTFHVAPPPRTPVLGKPVMHIRRPVSAAAAIGDTPLDAIDQAVDLAQASGSANVSFLGDPETLATQRLERQKSITTTRQSASYLKSQGSTIHFGPSSAPNSTISATRSFGGGGSKSAHNNSLTGNQLTDVAEVASIGGSVASH